MSPTLLVLSSWLYPIAGEIACAPGSRMRQSGLHVVGAVAAGLEGINADDLVSGQAGRRRGLHVRLLERDLAVGRLRHEAELLGRGREKIRHHRNVRLARLGGFSPAAQTDRPAAAVRHRPAAASARSRGAGSAHCCGAWHCGFAASRRSISSTRQPVPRKPGAPAHIARPSPDSRPRSPLFRSRRLAQGTARAPAAGLRPTGTRMMLEGILVAVFLAACFEA